MLNSLRNILIRALGHATPVRLAIAAATAAFFGAVVLGDQGLYQLKELLEMRQRLTSERVKLNDEIDRLAREKETLSDPANLEYVIRSELGYIRPGEVTFEERPAQP